MLNLDQFVEFFNSIKSTNPLNTKYPSISLISTGFNIL